MSPSDEQQTDSEWPLHVTRMSPSPRYGLLNTDVSSLYTQIHTLYQHNSSLLTKITSECPQILSHMQAERHHRGGPSLVDSSNENNTGVFAEICGLFGLYHQFIFSGADDVPPIPEPALPSFTSTANRYDTDTTAGALLLQEKFAQGFLYRERR